MNFTHPGCQIRLPDPGCQIPSIGKRTAKHGFTRATDFEAADLEICVPLRDAGGMHSGAGRAGVACALILSLLWTLTGSERATRAGPGIQHGLRYAVSRDRSLVSRAAGHIKHVIYIVKENRTYDHYFGRYPRGDGAATGTTSDGATIPLRPAADVFRPDLGHGFIEGVRAIDGGRMDGFDLVDNGETLNGYTSFTRAGLPA